MTQTTPLIERITAYPVCTAPEHEPQTTDRWVLASNLQKSIRRGLVLTAVGTASALLAVDPRYFWRRLLVIAYEDVGYGDISRCHDLLKTFRREALHRDLGPQRVAQFFAQELAAARKSRALCDALAMLDFSVQRNLYERQAFALTADELLAIVCHVTMPVINRMAALRHICGYGLFANGRYQTLNPPDRELMTRVCTAQGLSEVETTLFRSGQNIAESLNTPIPIIGPMTRTGQQTEQTVTQVFEGKHGLLYAALDRHTRIGKRCFARLAKEATPVREFFTQHPTLDPVAVIGAGMFIVEGAALDRWLVFDGSEQLCKDFNHNFLEHAGVHKDEQQVLLELVRSTQEQLNNIRVHELEQRTDFSIGHGNKLFSAY
jgi:hypothetical protein